MKSMRSLYKKLFHYVPDKRILAYFSMALSAAAVCSYMGAYWFLWQSIVSILVIPVYEKAMYDAIIVVILMILRGILNIASATCSHYLGFRLETNLRKNGLHKLLDASSSFFDHNSSGEIRKIIDDNAAETHKTVAHLIPDNVTAVMTPVLMFVLMFAIDYQNTYYTLSTERIPYRKDKTEDDRFFILTLFALAGEIEARGAYSSEVQRIQLAVGLPPAHFGAQVERFTQYFRQRGVIEFEMQGKPYSIYIEDAACFPQAYAAAATMLHTLVEEPKAVILDIGGFTADYLLMKNGEIDLTSCDSLENGVILLYNKVRSKVNSELDLLLDEGDVDAILMGKKTKYPDAAIRLTEQMAQEFISDLFSTLRERMLDLQYCKVVFVGGGAILLKRQIETSGKVGTPFFVPKINANADGYEYLYRIETAGR